MFAILELVRTGDDDEEERRAGEEDEVAREPSFRLCAGELLSSAVVSAAADAGAAVKLKRKVEKNQIGVKKKKCVRGKDTTEKIPTHHLICFVILYCENKTPHESSNMMQDRGAWH